MGLNVAIVEDQRFLEHKTGPVHPESPNRLKVLYQMLHMEFPDGLIQIEPKLATLEHLELVHTPAHIDKVLKTADHRFTSLAPDTPTSAKSYLAAWLAVGSCIQGLEALISNRCQACFLPIRPPGHHALPDRAAGFCIFNNLGITARYAMKRFGLKRILILDWDVHHGNGLNDLFYNEREVLYLSTHDTWLYPYTGSWEETGKGEGKGYTINLPVSRDLQDEDMLHLYNEVLSPLILRYEPKLILVAAGFDAHHQDPVGRSQLTERFFERLTHLLLDLRERVDRPPILFALEGGYDPQALASCVREVLKSLTTSQETEIDGLGEKTQRATELVEKARKIHRKYGVWVD